MYPSFDLLVAATPVVDIDGTFFVQGGLFLFMVFLLKPLLFTPWLEARERRASAIDGATAEAKQLREKATAAGSEYDQRLAEARARAATQRSQNRRQEETARARELDAARNDAARELEQQRASLQQQAAAARAQLAGRVDDLANDIVAKVLGRTA